MRHIKLTAVITREEDGYVSICPELDIASQGDTREEAKANLQEAVEGFLEAASETEVNQRLGVERYVEPLEVSLA
jgi:predicted RNase H-like HicB family nuclease